MQNKCTPIVEHSKYMLNTCNQIAHIAVRHCDRILHVFAFAVGPQIFWGVYSREAFGSDAAVVCGRVGDSVW
jgi:hypothetical protein